MNQTTLTIGMAHHNDFDGVYFTTQSIRMFHPDNLHRIELVVVDNSPGGEIGSTLRAFIEGKMKPFFRNVKYIPMTDRSGTSQTRNRIFSEATSDAVLCMDCHVLLAPHALGRLLDYYDAHPDSMDLLSGPLATEEPRVEWTHFNNQWRGHMWGTWGVAWEAGGEMFSPIEGPENRVEYRSLDGDGSRVITAIGDMRLPELPWSGHEAMLDSVGYRRATETITEPFDIPAQGLGLFTCRKDAWLGFNEHFRGFGGEEFYVHEKYRQAGRRNLCLPFLRWVHRFARPGGPKYRLQTEDRVRNYIIGHQELGFDLNEVYTHFVVERTADKPPAISEDTWQTILADPIEYGQNAKHAGGGCGSCRTEIQAMGAVEAYEHYAKRQSDFNLHFPKLRELAAQCEHVTEFGSRDYGVIPFLIGLSDSAGTARSLRSYNSTADGAAFWKAEQLAKDTGVKVLITHESPGSVDIEETDMLFYDPAESNLLADLERHAEKIRRYIVVHDTDIYGVRLPNGQPGLKLHLIQFMHNHPEWTVVYSTTQQYGLMVLSKNPADKPVRPSLIQMGPTFLRHLAEHVIDGSKNVTQEQLEERLTTCWLCDLRTKDSECSLCGCPILKKAEWRSSRCDANKWPAIDGDAAAQ